MKTVHYLTVAEEKSLKSDIPWDQIERRVRELVMRFNKVSGIATLQSCAGHVRPIEEHETFHVANAEVCIRVSEERYKEILDLAPRCGIRDIRLRYFDNGSFWISLEWAPSEYGPAYILTQHLLKEVVEGDE